MLKMQTVNPKYLVTLDVENVDTVNLKEMGACAYDNFIHD